MIEFFFFFCIQKSLFLFIFNHLLYYTMNCPLYTPPYSLTKSINNQKKKKNDLLFDNEKNQRFNKSYSNS